MEFPRLRSAWPKSVSAQKPGGLAASSPPETVDVVIVSEIIGPLRRLQASQRAARWRRQPSPAAAGARPDPRCPLRNGPGARDPFMPLRPKLTSLWLVTTEKQLYCYWLIDLLSFLECSPRCSGVPCATGQLCFVSKMVSNRT